MVHPAHVEGIIAQGTQESHSQEATLMMIQGFHVGDFNTNSDVFVADGYMYFQGTDQAVWRVSAENPMIDRNNFGGPKKIKTQSNIFVADGFMYFRGTDNKVWQMSVAPPHNKVNIGGLKTNSDIFVAGGYMYFQGTDQAVWRVSVSDPKNDRNNFGGPKKIKTQSNIFVADGFMYFRGTDDKVWQMSVAPPYNKVNIGGLKTKSNVFPAKSKTFPTNAIYFQGTDHKLWCYDFDDSSLKAYATVAIYALQDWYSWDAGEWNSTGFWNSANALYALIDYMAAGSDRDYTNVIGNTFAKPQYANFINDYYDDQGWWALTWINAYDFLVNEEQYLKMAKKIFNNMTDAWDGVCNGGIYWKADKTNGHGKKPYKNAIANELFLSIAVRLMQRSSSPAERQSYRRWAESAASWFVQSGMMNASNLINDGLTTDCQNDGNPTYSYNQGVILGALVDMARNGLTFAKQAPLTVAQQIANAVIAPGSPLSKNGILVEPVGPAAGNVGSDLPQFKGIFMRNLALLASSVDQATAAPYVGFIRDNMRSILASNRNSINQFGYAWSGPFDQADAARQASALEALNAARKVGLLTP